MGYKIQNNVLVEASCDIDNCQNKPPYWIRKSKVLCGEHLLEFERFLQDKIWQDFESNREKMKTANPEEIKQIAEEINKESD